MTPELQDAGIESPLPVVSCLCPTYRRPELLANALACFLAQDYPADRREMIILDDAGQFVSQQGPGWELISVSRRFRSLPEKFNALAGLAQGEVLVVWEDDDVYLPWHISAHIEALGSITGYSKPSRVRSHVNGALHEEGAAGRFHASIAFTREAFSTVQGWPLSLRGDFDQQFLSRLSGLGPVGDPIQHHSPSYVFRWEITRAYHGQGLMQGPGDEEWYQRATELGSCKPQLQLSPHFDANSIECFAELRIPVFSFENP